MDPAKLKVVELRAELASLGLDTKGNKPALVDRLRKALQDSAPTSFPPDTTIADTSTEEIDDVVESPPRRPGPASRTRRRLSSSERPVTPAKISRREVEPAIPEHVEEEPTVEPEKQKTPEPEPKPAAAIQAPAQEKATPVKAPPITEQKSPVVEAKPPVVEQKSPVAEAKAPTIVPKSPIIVTKSPVIEAKTSVIVPTPPAVEAKTPVLPKSPVVETKAPIVVPKSPVVEEKAPVIVPKSPVVEAKAAIVVPKSPVVEVKSSVVEQKSPVVEAKPPVVEQKSPVIQQTTPIVEIKSPIVQEKPAAVPEKPMVVDEKLPVVDITTVEDVEMTDISAPAAVSKEPEKESDDVEITEIKDTDPSKPSESKEVDDDSDKKDEEADKDDLGRKSRDRKRRDKSRWGAATDNGSDVQVTGEYYNIRDDDDRSRDRHRSISSTKRSPPRRKSPVRVPEPDVPTDRVIMSWYDSDLNLIIDQSNFLKATPLTDGGFAYCWAAGRASHGADKGKVCFEVKLENIIKKVSESGDPAIRIGWSTLDQSLHLGDGELSWGFESTGKKVNNSDLEDYGVALVEKDVVGVYLDMESDTCNISYTINGVSQGTAFEFEKSALNGAALFPHIIVRNISFKVNFGTEKHLLICLKKIFDIEYARLKEEQDEIKRNTPVKEEKIETVKAEDKPKDETQDKPKDETEDIITEETDDQPEEKTDDKPKDEAEDKPKDEEQADKKPEDGTDVGDKNIENVDGEKKPEPKKEGNDVTVKPTEIPKPEEPKPIIIDEAALIEKFLSEHNGDEGAIDSLASLVEGYIFIGKVPIEELIPGLQKYPDSETCDVIMMCGLPGSGKTFWATKYVSENPDKKFNILGTSALVEKMKVDCKPFKAQYSGRWEILVSKLTKSVSKLIEMASNRKRNYILDQTNVYPSAQRRKMREFVGFKRTAVVIVPDETTFTERQRLREEKDGKDVPDCAVWEMKANFVLPETCSWLEEVIFSELKEEEAKPLIDKYNKEAAMFSSGPGSGRNQNSRPGGPSDGPRRSRFDASGGDRGRFSDRRQGPPGPMRHRNDRRGDDRRWGGRGRQGWNDMGPRSNWSAPRDMPYMRDNRSREPPMQPFRGPPSGKRPEGGRGGYNRDNRNNTDRRPGGDRGDSDRQGRNRWGSNGGGSSQPRSGSGSQLATQPPANKPRPNNQMRQNGPAGGGVSTGGSSNRMPHGGQSTGGTWSQGGSWSGQQPGGQGQQGWGQAWSQNWNQGNWNQWNTASGNTNSSGAQGANSSWGQNWNRGFNQQSSNAANGQQGQWAQWPAGQGYGYWGSQWVQGANNGGANSNSGQAGGQGSQQAAAATTHQMWAQYAQAYAQGYSMVPNSGSAGAIDKK